MRKRMLMPILAICATAVVEIEPADAEARQDKLVTTDTSQSVAADERLAVEMLSEKLSINTNSIEVIHASLMNWPDSSLGCPRTGVDYLQVVTPGSIVLLRAGTKAYRVHVGNDRAIVCDKPMLGTSDLAARPPAGAQMQGLMQKASTDLARRLNVNPTEISMGMIESVTWPDAALGCEGSDQDSNQTRVKGYRISLVHAGRTFDYHTDDHRVIPCPTIESQ